MDDSIQQRDEGEERASPEADHQRETGFAIERVARGFAQQRPSQSEQSSRNALGQRSTGTSTVRPRKKSNNKILKFSLAASPSPPSRVGVGW